MTDPSVVCEDARVFLRSLPDGCADAVITDPPYPEVIRSYGRISVPMWEELMHEVVRECRRVLTPHGSAVFILQPNQERVGRTRPWLWDFMSWCCREWNMVQDAWWWNPATIPTVHAHRTIGLMRPSVKACVWVGDPDCFRDQSAVLWRLSQAAMMMDPEDRALHRSPSGQTKRPARIVATMRERGGATPYNLLPFPNSNSTSSSGASGHPAGTPINLCSWWVRYLTPMHSLVLDPFAGGGTVGVAALRLGRRFLGSELQPDFAKLANETLAAEADSMPLMSE